MTAGTPPRLEPAQLTAVVFAGSSGPPAHLGGRNKNYFMLRGRPVVQRQLDLARELGFGRIVLVTELSRLSSLEVPEGTIVLPASLSQADNFAAVKAAVPFGSEDRCLVLFGDTPALTKGVVEDFLARCSSDPADVQHGLVPYVFVEPFMEYFPRDRKGRTPFHVREFLARLGCLTVVRPFSFDPAATRRRVGAVMRGRKQDPEVGGFVGLLVQRARVLWGGLRFIGPLGAWIGLVSILSHWLHERGFPAAARFTRRPVTLARLDGIFSELMGCKARFVPCPFGAASLDIDNDQDLEVHQRYLDDMLHLTQLQERLARRLADRGFDMGPASLAALDRDDAEAAAEIRRHPEVVREQQRILQAFPVADAGRCRGAA